MKTEDLKKQIKTDLEKEIFQIIERVAKSPILDNQKRLRLVKEVARLINARTSIQG